MEENKNEILDIDLDVLNMAKNNPDTFNVIYMRVIGNGATGVISGDGEILRGLFFTLMLKHEPFKIIFKEAQISLAKDLIKNLTFWQRIKILFKKNIM